MKKTALFFILSCFLPLCAEEGYGEATDYLEAGNYSSLHALAGEKGKVQANQDEHELVHLSYDNFRSVIRNNQFVIIDVYTEWCGPCKHLAPVIEDLNDDYGHLYQFAKLDADEEKYLASYLQVTTYPTIIFVKDGKEVGRQIGFLSKGKLLSKIKHYFK